jgi:hypothetical protein
MNNKMSSTSISDIVNAKIIELLLECCRKTVIECSQHYGFSSEEALGKMGLLTDYSKLYLQPTSSEESVSDVSVKTPILVSEEKPKKVSKPRVKKEKVVVPAESPEGVSTEAKVEVKEKKVSKPRVKKEKVVAPVVVNPVVDNVVVAPVVVAPVAVSEVAVSEVVVSEVVDQEKPKKVRKPRVKKEKKEGEEDSTGTSSKKEKGRPKKEKKEIEVASPIDDLFANLVGKEEVSPEVDVVNKMEFQGTTYLKSKNTGIIYNMDQDVVGKWNENTKTIDFEEEEEEYEEE